MVESLSEAIRDARTAPTRSKHLPLTACWNKYMDRAAFPHSCDAALSRRCSCDARSGGPVVRLQGCRVIDQFAHASAGR